MEGQAELEVLKCILCREGYLKRLHELSLSVMKKFKPEIADVIDLYRSASIDLIDAIVKWRDVKGDHELAYFWNGINYIIKMPSDLDFLSEYLAIRKWMGFKLDRNPFCIPFPMEDGAHIYEEAEKKLGRDTSTSMAPVGNHNFLMSEEMIRIRKCESIIMKEESRWGVYRRDLEGRVIPLLQAESQMLANELAKDTRRPINEKAKTNPRIALHAAHSDVGIAEESWIPDVDAAKKLAEAQAALLEKKQEQLDPDLAAKDRGQQKIGGHLIDIQLKGSESSIRKPLMPSLASDVEFGRERKKTGIQNRLTEIDKLKAKIEKEKAEFLATFEEPFERSEVKSRERSTRLSKKATLHPDEYFNRVASVKKLVKDPATEARSSSAKGTRESQIDPIMRSSSVKEIEGMPLKEFVQTMPLKSSDEVPAVQSRKSSLKSGLLVSASMPTLEGVDTNTLPRSGSPEPIVEETESDRKLKEVKKAEFTLKMDEKLTSLRDDEIKLKQELSHLKLVDKSIKHIKQGERRTHYRDRSKDIERKRRLLSKNEGKLVNTKLNIEPKNQYDYYTTLIQKAIRGFVARRYVARHRKQVHGAVVRIQAYFRGSFSRYRVRMKQRQHLCATVIQKNFRGWRTRGISQAMAKGKNLGRACKQIQRIFRGFLGKRRLASKRRLDVASALALEIVDPTVLYPSDVRELAKRIQYAIEEPMTTTFPPDEVLYLLRLTIMILQSAKGLLGLTEYSKDFGIRYYDEIDGENLTWQQASMMALRSERFMRLVRGIAFGAASKPPRLIQISGQVHLINAAVSLNPKWCEATFETMGMGSKVCVQLFKWLKTIMEVAIRQTEFVGFITSSFPDWLPKLLSLQKTARAVELDNIVLGKCLEKLEELFQANKDDSLFSFELEREMIRLRRVLTDSKIRYRDIVGQADELRSVQASREENALITLSKKIQAFDFYLQDLLNQYSKTQIAAEGGDAIAAYNLTGLRTTLTNEQLKSAEMHSQYKVLEAQCEANREKRKNPAKLDSNTVVKANAAGEAKALHSIALVKQNAMMRSTGLKYLTDYNREQSILYEELHADEVAKKHEARNAFVAADEVRKGFDFMISQEISQAESRETSCRDFFVASEAELLEERMEDDRTAVEERNKKRQFIPDAVLFETKERPRPVIVALARDISNFAKIQIHRELTRQIPGTFTVLDIDKNMGLDVAAMQSALDAKMSIIMHVDHGITYLTRMSFLNSFEMSVRALVPNPYVIMVIGDDGNKRSPEGSALYGVSSHDLNNMRDKDIKISMESMVYSLDTLSSDEMMDRMMRVSNEVLPPSRSYIVVAEALYVIHSKSETTRTPEGNISGVSWRSLRFLFSRPEDLIAQMRSIKRGDGDLRLCELVKAYTEHEYWPPATGDERKLDIILHLVANYVECWLISERMTLDRNGLPNPIMFKNIVKSIQSVVPVIDDRLNNDDIEPASNSGWRIPTALILRTSLQDMRVLKSVIKIDDHLYNLSMYRQGSTIYFDVYDPANSKIFIESIPVKNVPRLLMPDAFAVARGANVNPPETPYQMYASLSKLLRFEKVCKQKGSRLRLVCSREYVFNRYFNARIDGHRVVLYCFEAALGEMFFSAYLPEYSCKLTFFVDEEVRKHLWLNADPELERKLIEENIVVNFMPYLIDRLRISPSRTVYSLREYGYLLDEQHDRRSAIGSDPTMGLKLKCRCKGGVGRLLLRTIIKFCGISHVLSVKSSSATKTMIVFVYEPRMSTSVCIRVTQTQRKLIFGHLNDDINTMKKPLLKRLKYNWRGGHSCYFDMSVFRGVRRIYGSRRCIIEISLVDEFTVKVTLIDPEISEFFESNLTKDQLVILLHYVPPPPPKKSIKTVHEKVVEPEEHFDFVEKGSKFIQNIAEAISSGASPKNASEVQNQNLTINTEEPASTNEEKIADVPVETTPMKPPTLEPAFFDISLLNLLENKVSLSKIVDNLSLVLTIIDEKSFHCGYFCHSPCDLTFMSPGDNAGRNINCDAPFESDVIHTPWLKQGPRENSVEGVVRSRRQVPIVQMDKALIELAQERAKEAAKIAAENARRAEELAYATGAIQKRELSKTIDDATTKTAEGLLDAIHLKQIARLRERLEPGFTQEEMLTAKIAAADGSGDVEVDLSKLTEEQREIVIKGEELIFDRGCRTNYVDGKARWYGHVNVKVYAGLCYMGEDGVGRKLRFSVFEPSCSMYFEASILTTKRLREILGKEAQDLLEPDKLTEMLLFVIKYRMDLVRNNVDWSSLQELDGQAQMGPPYIIKFQYDRLYNAEDKVTPINKADEEDAAANADKLIDLEHMRGKKLLRMVRRIGNILFQLAVFEIPTPSHLKSLSLEQMRSQVSDTKISVPRETVDGELKIAPADLESGYAETRAVKNRAEYREAPTIRITAYDPHTKKKMLVIGVPEAVKEVAGGGYSPFLEATKRRELARIVCESMILNVSKNGDIELAIPWAGGIQKVPEKQLAESKLSKNISKRPGRIFQSALRISNVELVVTMFSFTQIKCVVDESIIVVPGQPPVTKNVENRQIIANFYSVAISDAFEVTVNEDEQIDRMGKAIIDFDEGTVRAAAIRRFCRYFRARIEEDAKDETIKFLKVSLSTKDFETEYKEITPLRLRDNDVRPVGVPMTFLPLDSCGDQFYTRGVRRAVIGLRPVQVTSAIIEDIDVNSIDYGMNVSSEQDFLITLYSKRAGEGPEKGIVCKIYDKENSLTAILHVGPSEIKRLLARAGVPELLDEIVELKAISDRVKLDEIEQSFLAVTEKGEGLEKANALKKKLFDILVNDIGLKLDAENRYFPYMLSAPKGAPPV